MTRDLNGQEIIDDIYAILRDFRARGLEPPGAIGLTRSELERICRGDGQVFEEAMLPLTMWGHPIIMVKG